MIEPGACVSFTLSPAWTIFLDGKWTRIWNLRGDTYVRADGGTVFTPFYATNGAGSGAESSVSRIRFGAAFTFP
jgi:hypothetical protein